MSQVPGRLVYTDSNGNQQVIGTFLPSDPTEGNISTFTIDEDAKNYKRVIIEGAPQLYEQLPTSVTEFEGDEREIIAQEDENNDGNWTDRVRVYPEKGGVTNERGKYKNEHLWGFKKNIGEDDVEIDSAVTTNLEDVLEALLPNGYTARYPSDISPPNVSNYTFNGSRQKAFNEIRQQYNHFIIFTAETDGSGNYYVDLQPKGYGDTQFSLVRGQDAYTYNNWKKADTSNVVSKVKVIGKDSNGGKIERVIAAGTSTGVHGDDSNVDVYLGTPEPDKKRYKSVKIDYTITQTEADDIGERIIDPTATEHGEIEADLNIDSTLNQSVGINDENRTPNNPIDDVFTVVKQKDFLHQGTTLYSFEFESEASQEQVDKWREHDNERATIYPDSPEDVGNQTVSGDTNSDNADLTRSQDTVAQGSDGPNKEKANLRRDPDTSVGQVETELGYFVGAYNDDITGDNGSGWQSAEFFVVLDDDDYLFNAAFPSIQIQLERIQSGPQNCDVSVRIKNRTTGEYFPDSVGVKIMDEVYMQGDIEQAYTVSVSQYLHAPFNWNNEEFEIQYKIDVDGLVDAEMFYSYHGSEGHVHDDDIEIEREDTLAQQPEAVLETDPQANITTQPIFTDNGHFHVIDTTTSAKNINLLSEVKSDR